MGGVALDLVPVPTVDRMARLRPCVMCGTPMAGACTACGHGGSSGWAARRPPDDGTLGAEWRTIRRRVLDEEPRCRLCQAPSTTVDHILNRARGGTHARVNLRALCRDCHRTKTAQEGADARARAIQRRGEG